MTNRLNQIERLNQKAWVLCKKDAPKAFRLALKIQNLISADPQVNPVDEFLCLRTQAYCLDLFSKPEEALIAANRANQLAQALNDTDWICSIQSNIGRIYWHIDDYSTSTEYYLNALKLAKNNHNSEMEISLINGLGLNQFGLGNYSKALEYFQYCLEIVNGNDLSGQAYAYNNIAYCLYKLGREPEALEHGTTSLSLFTQLGTAAGMMETLHTLGAIQIALGNFDQALDYLQRGVGLSHQNQNQLLEITCRMEISRIFQIRGDFTLEKKELLQLLPTARKINSLTNIAQIHEWLAEVYKRKHNYQAALMHFEAFHRVHQKIFNDKSDQRIKVLEIMNQVETTRKQAEIYRELAGSDYLTHMNNRMSFQEKAEIAHKRAQSEKLHLAIIMLDIDHFKSYNDRFGHKIGDEILAIVASMIKDTARNGDITARYGGDEFIVLVVNTPAPCCFKIAERIRQAIAQKEIQVNGAAVKVTISVGFACYDPDQLPPLDRIIACADQAMYWAKQNGRNCVVAWDAISM